MKTRTQNNLTLAFLIIAIIIGIIVGGLQIGNSTNKVTYTNVRIQDKIQQQLVKEKHTDIRYLIVTDKGTFTSQANWFYGKFNSSDVFFHLVKDSTYSSITVTGYGKSALFDYQNVLEVK